MGTYRKMRAVFLALVILPAAIASSSGSASTYASAYSSASDSSSSYASAATSSSVGTIQVVKASLKLPGVTVTAFDKSTDSGKKLRTAFKTCCLGPKDLRNFWDSSVLRHGCCDHRCVTP